MKDRIGVMEYWNVEEWSVGMGEETADAIEHFS
jgi:hypothetical protein